MTNNFAIGVDIGGTNTKFGIVSRDGKILEQDRMLTNSHDAVQDFIDELFVKLKPLVDHITDRTPKGKFG